MTSHSASDADRTNWEAVDWVVRVGDPAFSDWPLFEAWLSSSPANARAYHAAAAAEAEIVEALAEVPRPVPVSKVPHPVPVSAAPALRERRRHPLAWGGGALAASLLAVGAYQLRRPAPAPEIYETAPGASRSVALADGSHVLLNGGTRLVVDGADRRGVSLPRGEALFSVRHDSARPFRVRVGDADVVDVGTRFDVTREGGETRVAVSEGAIDWRRGGDSVRVEAGHDLHARDGSPDVALGATTPSSVGGWSRGQLEYDGAPLGQVAADLSRALGVPVSADGAVAHDAIRGVVQLGGGAQVVLPRVAAMAGVRARETGGRWRLLASP